MCNLSFDIIVAFKKKINIISNDLNVFNRFYLYLFQSEMMEKLLLRKKLKKLFDLGKTICNIKTPNQTKFGPRFTKSTEKKSKKKKTQKGKKIIKILL